MGAIKETAIELVIKVEEALGVKLYQSQIDYLLQGSTKGFEKRRSGFTTIYIVKLLLSNDTLSKSELSKGTYCDLDIKIYNNYKHYFKREFVIIREKLLAAGLSVAGLI